MFFKFSDKMRSKTHISQQALSIKTNRPHRISKPNKLLWIHFNIQIFTLSLIQHRQFLLIKHKLMILNILLNLYLRQTLLFPPGVGHDSPQIIFIILQGRLSFKKQPLGLRLLFLNLLL